ncbi:hypothetical protein GTP09_15200 [Lactiplantibacillus plantarum]|nr:hypothetical protein [Lactiplantibacillus plantarum]
MKATDVYLRGEFGQKALKPLLRAEVQKMDLIYIENLKKETKTDTI